MNSEHMLVKVKDFIQGTAAVSSDDGDLLFEEINNSLKSNSILTLDFEGITLITTAFLNSAIGQLYSKYTSTDLNNHIKLVNIADEDKILFIKVIERAKEYFQNKKKFDDSANSAIYGE